MRLSVTIYLRLWRGRSRFRAQADGLVRVSQPAQAFRPTIDHAASVPADHSASMPRALSGRHRGQGSNLGSVRATGASSALTVALLDRPPRSRLRGPWRVQNRSGHSAARLGSPHTAAVRPQEGQAATSFRRASRTLPEPHATRRSPASCPERRCSNPAPSRPSAPTWRLHTCGHDRCSAGEALPPGAAPRSLCSSSASPLRRRAGAGTPRTALSVRRA